MVTVLPMTLCITTDLPDTCGNLWVLQRCRDECEEWTMHWSAAKYLLLVGGNCLSKMKRWPADICSWISSKTLGLMLDGYFVLCIFFYIPSLWKFSLTQMITVATNLTDFRDNSLLKLQVGGPFLGGMEAVQEAQEYILIQVEQTEEAGPRRRRTQQVRVVFNTPERNSYTLYLTSRINYY